jgi:hypothetical protein
MCDIFTAPVTVSNRQIATNKMCDTAVFTINCTITNNVSIHSHDSKDGDMQLAVGVTSLQETIAGLEVHLPPVKNLWNTVHGAEMLCQALEKLLAPSKKMTVLDIGCGIGLLGLYLSKVCIACSIFLFVCCFVCLFLSLKYCRGKERVVSIYRLVLLLPLLLLSNNNDYYQYYYYYYYYHHYYYYHYYYHHYYYHHYYQYYYHYYYHCYYHYYYYYYYYYYYHCYYHYYYYYYY